MQEVRKPNSDHYVSDEGYTVILSGASNVTVEWAGVGFIVAPSLRHKIDALQFSNRIATLKLRTQGGMASITTVYAPTNLAAVDAKQQFYESLLNHLNSFSANGIRIVCGDLNA
jgi:exonuclease III